MMQNFNVNADYIAGLIQSDGSFIISINEKNSFGLRVSISSLTNTNNLSLIKAWLTAKAINSDIYSYIVSVHVPVIERSAGTPSSRCELTISGNKQVKRFLDVLQQEITSDFLFCGVKQRDYLRDLVQAFLSKKKTNIV